MNIISSPTKSLQGSISIPGDKSISHRAALFAALSEGESRIENFLVAGVTSAMLQALTSLGVSWELIGTTLIVRGKGVHGITSPTAPIDCRNSATTMRLLAGALAVTGVDAVLDGSPGLRRRPMGRIIDPLKKMGVEIEAADGKTAPLRIHGRPSSQPLRPIDYTLPVASAQVKSCLLIAALAADGISTFHEPGPSRDHTERMLLHLGVSVNCASEMDSGKRISLTPPSSSIIPPLNIFIPGDISSSSFVCVAASIVQDAEVLMRNVGLNPTRTGLIDVLSSMGGDIQIMEKRETSYEPFGDLVVRNCSLQGIRISGQVVVRMIDEFPALAIAAATAIKRTEVCDAGELRNKESDRISALCMELNLIGVEATETTDGFIIQGGKPILGGTVQSHTDHRLAMALVLAGLVAQHPIIVQGSEVISESYPDFMAALNHLGAHLSLEA